MAGVESSAPDEKGLATNAISKHVPAVSLAEHYEAILKDYLLKCTQSHAECDMWIATALQSLITSHRAGKDGLLPTQELTALMAKVDATQPTMFSSPYAFDDLADPGDEPASLTERIGAEVTLYKGAAEKCAMLIRTWLVPHFRALQLKNDWQSRASAGPSNGCHCAPCALHGRVVALTVMTANDNQKYANKRMDKVYRRLRAVVVHKSGADDIFDVHDKEIDWLMTFHCATDATQFIFDIDGMDHKDLVLVAKRASRKWIHKFITRGRGPPHNAKPPPAKALFVENSATSPAKTCSVAGCAGEGVHQCGRCSSAWYCSKKCQRHHWKRGGHRQECAQLREEIPVPSLEDISAAVAATGSGRDGGGGHGKGAGAHVSTLRHGGGHDKGAGANVENPRHNKGTGAYASTPSKGAGGHIDPAHSERVPTPQGSVRGSKPGDSSLGSKDASPSLDLGRAKELQSRVLKLDSELSKLESSPVRWQSDFLKLKLDIRAVGDEVLDLQKEAVDLGISVTDCASEINDFLSHEIFSDVPKPSTGLVTKTSAGIPVASHEALEPASNGTALLAPRALSSEFAASLEFVDPSAVAADKPKKLLAPRTVSSEGAALLELADASAVADKPKKPRRRRKRRSKKRGSGQIDAQTEDDVANREPSKGADAPEQTSALSDPSGKDSPVVVAENATVSDESEVKAVRVALPPATTSDTKEACQQGSSNAASAQISSKGEHSTEVSEPNSGTKTTSSSEASSSVPFSKVLLSVREESVSARGTPNERAPGVHPGANIENAEEGLQGELGDFHNASCVSTSSDVSQKQTLVPDAVTPSDAPQEESAQTHGETHVAPAVAVTPLRSVRISNRVNAANVPPAIKKVSTPRGRRQKEADAPSKKEAGALKQTTADAPSKKEAGAPRKTEAGALKQTTAGAPSKKEHTEVDVPSINDMYVPRKEEVGVPSKKNISAPRKEEADDLSLSEIEASTREITTGSHELTVPVMQAMEVARKESVEVLKEVNKWSRASLGVTDSVEKLLNGAKALGTVIGHAERVRSIAGFAELDPITTHWLTLIEASLEINRRNLDDSAQTILSTPIDTLLSTKCEQRMMEISSQTMTHVAPVISQLCVYFERYKFPSEAPAFDELEENRKLIIEACANVSTPLLNIRPRTEGPDVETPVSTTFGGTNPETPVPTNMARAKPETSVPKNVSGAKSEASTTKVTSGANSEASGPKGVDGTAPGTPAPKAVTGAKSATSAPRALGGAKPEARVPKSTVAVKSKKERKQLDKVNDVHPEEKSTEAKEPTRSEKVKTSKSKKKKRVLRLHACTRKECAKVEQARAEFQQCGLCTARYCSKECSKLDWKKHRKTHKSKKGKKSTATADASPKEAPNAS